VDPTDPVPDYVVVLHPIDRSAFGWSLTAEIQATGTADVNVAMDSLHRHTRSEVDRHAWVHGYTVSSLTWNDIELTSRGPMAITATAVLVPRDDDVWKSIRQAVLEDEHDLRTLEHQRAVEEEASIPQWQRRLRRRRPRRPLP
jgi:hypothetical protein